MTWRTVLLVAAGGAVGSALRYVLSVLMNLKIGAGFPWATFIINVAGSLAIGLVVGLATARVSWMTPELRLFTAVGVLGGFTTFSTFSLELVGLVGERAFTPALIYAVASIALGFAAAFTGLYLTRSLIT